ncbi:MAG: hypothetical protein IKT38_01765 [Clostridia bacterium]|nr:hypothetical protein [Clostridia bacterium]
MNKFIKRILSVVLVLCMAMIPVYSASAATPDEVMPCYNNTASTTTTMNINSSGKMTITYKYAGYSSITTKAVITTYIEKKTLGLFWSRVDIGQPDDQWVDTVYDYRYSATRTGQLPSSGTYRVTVVYKIYGSGGSADVIEYQAQDSY